MPRPRDRPRSMPDLSILRAAMLPLNLGGNRQTRTYKTYKTPAGIPARPFRMGSRRFGVIAPRLPRLPQISNRDRLVPNIPQVVVGVAFAFASHHHPGVGPDAVPTWPLGKLPCDISDCGISAVVWDRPCRSGAPGAPEEVGPTSSQPGARHRNTPYHVAHGWHPARDESSPAQIVGPGTPLFSAAWPAARAG